VPRIGGAGTLSLAQAYAQGPPGLATGELPTPTADAAHGRDPHESAALRGTSDPHQPGGPRAPPLQTSWIGVGVPVTTSVVSGVQEGLGGSTVIVAVAGRAAPDPRHLRSARHRNQQSRPTLQPRPHEVLRARKPPTQIGWACGAASEHVAARRPLMGRLAEQHDEEDRGHKGGIEHEYTCPHWRHEQAQISTFNSDWRSSCNPELNCLTVAHPGRSPQEEGREPAEYSAAGCSS